VGNHIFVALRSTHKGKPSQLGSIAGPRIRKKQIGWAIEHLRKLQTGNDSIDLFTPYVSIDESKEEAEKVYLHLVTHHSLWKDEDDPV
jgi:hypothetical protein